MDRKWIAALTLLLPALAPAQLKTQLYASGLAWPVAMVQHPTDGNVQFVVQQRGRIRVLVNGAVQATDFLNISALVHQTHSEGGLLGLAFHPQYAKNRQFYVYYTDTSGDSHVVRYLRSAGDPLVADPGSAFPIIFIDQPFSNHNGGTIRFGPSDGYLYIGLGDGGSGNDPGNRAQDVTNMLLGKMLRIDVDLDAFPADPNRNYANPSTNPFASTTGDDEIWAYGLRNPWKWSFDPPSLLGNGGILIGDVGQNAWEEVDYEPPLTGGRNYGWREFEGFVNTGLGGGDGGPYIFPVHAYSHAAGGVSVTGGHVYRGLLLGDYFGRYFFSDFGTGQTWSFLLGYDGAGEGTMSDLQEHTADLGLGGVLISSIDVDRSGEVYIVVYNGTNGRIYKVLPENRVWLNSVQPVNNTGLSGDLRALSAADGKLFLTRRGLVLSSSQGFRSTYLLNMQTDMAAPSFLDVFVDVGANQNFSPGGLEVRMRNWTTGNLDVVGNGAITNTIETRQFLGVPAADYVRATDGAVQVQLMAWTTGLLLSSNPIVRYDRVKLVVR